MTNGRKGTSATESRSMADILALAKPREASVTVCLAGDLAAEVDRITAELDALEGRPATSLADGAARARLTAELDEVRELMQEAEVTFRFRALEPKDYSDLIAAHPCPGKDWDPDTLPPDLLARSAVEPKMTLEEAQSLYSVVNDGDRGRLFSAAWRANNTAIAIPTSRAASANPSLSDAR